MSGNGVDAASVVAISGEILFVVLIAFIAAQVYGNARTAKTHVANAVALKGMPQLETLGARTASPAAPSDEDAPQIVAQLNQYYAANISQGYAIFWASLLAMIVGFVVILAGIDAAGTNPTTAIVAGIAGVLSQFIAATFVVALRSTQQQSTVYAQTLAELRTRDLRAQADARAIELGLQLLGEIAGDDAIALVNQTRAALAMGLIVKEHNGQPLTPPVAPSAPAAIDVDDAQRNGTRFDARTRVPTVTSADTAVK